MENMSEKEITPEPRKVSLRYISGAIYAVTAVLIISFLAVTFANYLSG